MGIIKKLKSKIHSKLIDHYIKKGIRIALKDINSKNQFTEKHKEKLIADIETLSSHLREGIYIYSSALEGVENEYGPNKYSAEEATIFPFLYLSIIDILTLMKLYLKTNNTEERIFICKTAGLHLYEFTEDAPKAFGKQIGLIIESLKDPDLKKELYNLRKSLHSLKKDLHEFLKIIRNNVSGHKDRDIRKQLKISASISLNEFENYFTRFVNLFSLIFQLNKSVTQAILKTKPSN